MPYVLLIDFRHNNLLIEQRYRLRIIIIIIYEDYIPKSVIHIIGINVMSSAKKYSIIFRCAVPKCSYSSKRMYNLQRHAKTHTRTHWHSKRFPCPRCAYAAATRAHLKRHIGNKHPSEDISKLDLRGLSYEAFDECMEMQNEDVVEEEEKEVQPEMNIVFTEQNDQVFEGPVTVLQMVTPSSPQSELIPGEVYYDTSLEGEVFRLIPVALLPSKADAEGL